MILKCSYSKINNIIKKKIMENDMETTFCFEYGGKTIKCSTSVVQSTEYPKIINWVRLPIQSLYMCCDKKHKKKHTVLNKKKINFYNQFFKNEKINSRRIY